MKYKYIRLDNGNRFAILVNGGGPLFFLELQNDQVFRDRIDLCTAWGHSSYEIKNAHELRDILDCIPEEVS